MWLRQSVGKVEIFDPSIGAWRVLPGYATEFGAAEVGGRIIEGTQILIDREQLIPGEQWTSPDFVPDDEKT